MKKLFVAVMMSLALVSSGCESSTPYGECIGVGDDPQPHLVYKTSVRNAVLGIVFFETVFAPIVWLVSDFKCPVAQK